LPIHAITGSTGSGQSPLPPLILTGETIMFPSIRFFHTSTWPKSAKLKWER